MYFFLIKAMLGAIVGQSTNAWFKKTAMGKWFYKKVESGYNWAAERYDLKVLTAEEKTMKRFPALTKKMADLEKRINKLEK